MKIKLSKSQWEGIGKKAGWMKKAKIIQDKNGNIYDDSINPQQTPAAPQQNPNTVQKGNVNWAGLKYNALVQKVPQIKQMVDWLSLALRNKGNLTPDQEKQIRSTQANLKSALGGLNYPFQSSPEIMAVL